MLAPIVIKSKIENYVKGKGRNKVKN